jgi:hypothetical protein
MAEWFKALVSKTNKDKTFGGSNPPFSGFYMIFYILLFII